MEGKCKALFSGRSIFSFRQVCEKKAGGLLFLHLPRSCFRPLFKTVIGAQQGAEIQEEKMCSRPTFTAGEMKKKISESEERASTYC